MSEQSIEVGKLLANRPLTATDSSLLLDLLSQAIERAATEGAHTWLTDDGRTVAAITAPVIPLSEHELETIEAQMRLTREEAETHPLRSMTVGAMVDPDDWRKGWHPVSVPATDPIAKISRVIGELMRNGNISAASIGLHLEPGAPAGWNQQIERWLRGGGENADAEQPERG